MMGLLEAGGDEAISALLIPVTIVDIMVEFLNLSHSQLPALCVWVVTEAFQATASWGCHAVNGKVHADLKLMLAMAFSRLPCACLCGCLKPCTLSACWHPCHLAPQASSSCLTMPCMLQLAVLECPARHAGPLHELEWGSATAVSRTVTLR